MRFKFDLPIVNKALLLSSAIYVTYLASQGQLNLYIHPRYIIFTTIMAVIGLAMVLADFYFKTNRHKQSSTIFGLTPLVLLLAFAIILPARTLTSATVSQRTIDDDSVIVTADAKPISSLFAGSSRGLKISDWSRLLATNNDPTYYVNKPAKVSGFVYDAQLGSDTVWLARFVLTCCAVDAQPVGIPVQLKNWPAEYERDQWVEVEGEFSLAQTADGEKLVLIPTAVSKIEEPSNPYAN